MEDIIFVNSCETLKDLSLSFIAAKLTSLIKSDLNFSMKDKYTDCKSTTFMSPQRTLVFRTIVIDLTCP